VKKIAIRVLILLITAGAVAGGFYYWRQAPKGGASEIALTEVKRGDLTIRTHFRGELRAVRSTTLNAPNLGSQTQLTALAPAGALARRGDLIFELDDSERVAAMEDDLLEVEGIQQQLKQAETELEIRKTQDEVELVRADFQVRKAELEVRRNELISAIDARKNELTLEEAKRRKQKLEEDIKNRLAQREAELAVLREQLKKANLDVGRERRRIEQARMLAPLSGLVSILENRSGGRGGFGQAMPTIREGDQVPAGIAVAQLLDLSEMELIAKVEEVERANLQVGQEAIIRLDALPHKTVKGRVKRLGNTASMNIFRGEATKKFDCVLTIDMRQLLESVGAKPDQVDRILATARENSSRGSSGGRRGGVSSPAAAPADAPGPASAPGQRPAAGAGGPGGGPRSKNAGGASGRLSRMPAEMREQVEKLLNGRDISDLSQEERRKIFQQMRGARGGTQGGGGRRAGGQGGGPAGFPGGGRSPGGPGGGPGQPAPSADIVDVPRSIGGFSAEQRQAASLPQAPEEGSDVDILLRPGLLADAEVIVDEIKDVLYVPYQAVFESPKGPIVYAWNGSAIEPRQVELGRRSESQIEIASGLDEGDRIALEPPADARPARKKKPAPKRGGGPSFPTGGGGGGRGGRGGGGR